MNYQELIDAAKLYCDRQDQEVSSSMNIFIVLGEARINRLLKTREQSTRAYVLTVTDQEYYSLPSDYNGMRNIQLNSGDPSVEHVVSVFNYATPEQMDIFRANPISSKLYYTVIANQIQIYPCIDSGKNIELTYYQKVPPLTPVAPENWLSVSHPDCYIQAIAMQISLFVKDYAVAKSWDDMLSRSIKELQVTDIEERWAGNQLVIRTI